MENRLNAQEYISNVLQNLGEQHGVLWDVASGE